MRVVGEELAVDTTEQLDQHPELGVASARPTARLGLPAIEVHTGMSADELAGWVTRSFGL